MLSTSVSLLERLQTEAPSAEAWSDFVELYTPLLREWAERLGVQAADVGDLIQEVFLLLLRKLPDFRYAPSQHGGFRCWLRTVLINKWRELHRRKKLPLDHSPSAAADVVVPDGIEELSEQEYRQLLLRQALVLMQQQFQPATWRACWEHVVQGRPAAEVAIELNTTAGAVRVSSSRVLARLRELLAGFLE